MACFDIEVFNFKFIIMKVSKAIQKKLDRIEQLSAKDDLTTWELNQLAYNKLQLENKSASKVYKMLFEYPSDDIKEILSKALGTVQPTFATWTSNLKDKEFYSLWDGVLAVNKLSKSAQIASKVARQGGKVEPKTTASKAPKVA